MGYASLSAIMWQTDKNCFIASRISKLTEIKADLYDKPIGSYHGKFNLDDTNVCRSGGTKVKDENKISWN